LPCRYLGRIPEISNQALAFRERSTIETLRDCVAELQALREDLIAPRPLPRPKLRVIEGGETWVRDPEEEDS
jgi:hypothetical protein